MHRSNPSKGKELAKKALEISESLNYLDGWARGYYALGASSIWLSEYDNALTYSFRALDLLPDEGLQEEEIEVLYNISITYFLLDDLDNAFKYSQICLEHSEEIDYDQGKAIAINAKACVLYSDNRDEEAIAEIKKGLKYAKNAKDIEISAKLYDGLGQAYFNLGRYSEALDAKQKCLDIVKELNAKGTVAYALDGIGMIYLKQNLVEIAKEKFTEALQIRKEIGFVAGEAQSFLHLGVLFKLNKEYNKALEIYKKALNIGLQIKSGKIEYKAYHHLAEVYEEQNDLKNFSINYKKYHETKETFLKSQIQKKYQTRELVTQMKQVESEKFLLAKKNDELKKYSNDLNVLSEIGKELTSTLKFDEILEKVYNQVNSVMDASVFLIALYNEKTKDLSFELCVEKDIRMPDVTIKLQDGDGRLATYVVKNRKEVVINNYHEDISKLDNVNPGVLAGEMPESIIYMPIISNDKLIGLISVQSFERNAYSNYDIDLIRNLSVYAAIALKNAKTYRGIEEKVIERTKEIQKEKQNVENAHKNTKLIGELGQKLISSLHLDNVIDDVYEMMNRLMDAEYFGLNIFDPKTKALTCKYSIEKGVKKEAISFDLNDPENLAVWVINNKESLFLKNMEKDVPELFNKPLDSYLIRGEMPSCGIFIPLINNGEILGVLTTQSFKKNAYTEYQFNLLNSTSSYFIIALENARRFESMERIVESRTKEVIRQKEIIEEKNKRITDSIKYAKRIQEAILPTQKSILKYRKTSFVLFKPKDIVSGDFYWMEESSEKIIFAVVDCTGHGVPGAFMSIIGYNGLYQIVHEKGITKPSEILNRLNELVLNILRQTEDSDSISDGMDISICCFDKRKQILEFAGAFNPLYLVRKGELIQYKGDKFSVGSAKRMKTKAFRNHSIEIQQEDRIYIFSDGYADQFGGMNNKKFKYQNFREVLLQNALKPMTEQRNLLDEVIEEWKGEEDQVDDICVIGVSF